DRLESYLKEEAEMWERQAYLRARFLSGRSFQGTVLWQRPLTNGDLNKLKDIRGRLLKPIDLSKPNIKYGPGGLIDLEFAAQVAILQAKVQADSSSTRDLLTALAWPETLAKNYDRLRQLEQLLT